MNSKILMLLMCLIIFLHGCATSTSQKIKITAVPSRDQKIGNQEIITSQKKHFVSLGPYSELKHTEDKTIFMLGVKNCGKAPINISYDNISVMFEENAKKGDLKKVNLQPIDDFMNDFKEGYADYEKKYIKSALESIKMDSESSSSVISDSDNMGDKVKDLKTHIDAMRAQNQIIRERMPEIFLKSQSIMPDKSYNGIVVCDTRKMDDKLEGNFQVVVTVDGEVHKFIFKRK